MRTLCSTGVTCGTSSCTRANDNVITLIRPVKPGIIRDAHSLGLISSLVLTIVVTGIAIVNSLGIMDHDPVVRSRTIIRRTIDGLTICRPTRWQRGVIKAKAIDATASVNNPGLDACGRPH